MSLDEAVDVDEVSHLHREVSELKLMKQDFDKRIAVLVDQKRESGEKIIGLLAENSKLTTERDSLGANVKTFQGELSEVKKSLEPWRRSTMKR